MENTILDTEAVAYAETLIANKSLTWQKRLAAQIEWEEEHRGFIGMSPPYVAGIEADGEVIADAETVAENVFLMHLATLRGECTDITKQYQ